MQELTAYKKLAKLPRVVLESDMLTKIREWFTVNRLPMLVPPIFNRFVIEYVAITKYYVPQSDVDKFIDYGCIYPGDKDISNYTEISIPKEHDKLEPHEWLILPIKVEMLVEYDTSLTKVTLTTYESGKRHSIVNFDYNDYDNTNDTFKYHYTNGTPEDISSEVPYINDLIFSALAVQNYILYHKSEEIAEPKKIKVKSRDTNIPRKKAVKKRHDKIIKDQMWRTIIIRDDDVLPTKNYNYRTLAWNVRGHYARRGADKHMTYIAPYICRRNADEKKKPKNITYRIIEGDKENL